MPHLAVCSASTRRLVALSSTISTRLPCSSGCTPMKSRRVLGGSSATGASMVKEKVEPVPGPVALDPHAAAHQLGQALADRQAEAGAAVLARGAASRPARTTGTAGSCPRADRPMPVSRTAKVSRRGRRGRASRVTVSTTSPASVNLTALLSRFSRIWRSRVRSPLDADRHVALEHVGDVEVLLGRARADEVERRLHAVAQVERMRLDVHPAGLDLREVEDVVDDGQQRIARVADGRDVVAAARRRAACRAAGRSCRSPRSSACGSRGSSSRGTRSWPRSRPRRRRAPPSSRLNRRAFWIAITAWSAKVSSSLISLSANGLGGWRATWIEPMSRPSHISGATMIA